MSTRVELHSKLEELFGSKHIYYQPPESIKMEYPAIVYSKSDIETQFADNKAYSITKSYEVIVIDKKPDNPVIEKLLALPYCRFDRHYKSDNLNHDVLTIYY